MDIEHDWRKERDLGRSVRAGCCHSKGEPAADADCCDPPDRRPKRNTVQSHYYVGQGVSQNEVLRAAHAAADRWQLDQMVHMHQARPMECNERCVRVTPDPESPLRTDALKRGRL